MRLKIVQSPYLRPLFPLAARIQSRLADDQITLIAAGIAFYGMLAMFPTITAVLAIAGLLLDQNELLAQLDRLHGVIPDDVLDIVRTQATSVTNLDSLKSTLIASLILAIWSASRGVSSLCLGLNIAYDVRETRGFFQRNVEIFLLTAICILGMALFLALIVAMPVALSYVPLGPAAEYAADTSRWVLLTLMSICGISMIYEFGPSRRQEKWLWSSLGAVIACITWIAASYGFTLYVENFSNYNKSFGALAGVVVLLMWMWISALALLVGAEVNAAIARHATKETPAE